MNPTGFDPGPLADVASEVDQGRATLVFVRQLRHPVDAVWAALTDATQLAEWAPFTASRDLDAEGDATLTMIDGDTRVPLAATVHRVEPPRLLEYSWGHDLLSWRLEPLA